jgi:hypothetical protein
VRSAEVAAPVPGRYEDGQFLSRDHQPGLGEGDEYPLRGRQVSGFRAGTRADEAGNQLDVAAQVLMTQCGLTSSADDWAVSWHVQVQRRPGRSRSRT